MKMNWKDYENKVFNALSPYYIEDIIKQDFHIKGRYSKRSRQIDIYIKEDFSDKSYVTIIDSKNYNKKINVKIIEAFISMIDDVGADYGIIISELGFTNSAHQRAINNPKGIDLDIYDFNSITHNLQGEFAMPYVGKNAAMILAPFGWIVDVKKRSEFHSICYLFKKGLTIETAIALGEYAYINFWIPEKSISTINELSDLQVSNLKKIRIIDNVEYQQAHNNLNKNSLIRIIIFKDYPLIEIVGFIQFDNFIFFCVCNTRELFVRRNIRKMHLLLKQTLPMEIKKINK